jgi:hypothetical protein
MGAESSISLRKKKKKWVASEHLTTPAIGIKYITIGYD